MHAVDASPAPLTGVAPRSGAIAAILVPVGTVLVILAVAILPLLTPWFTHRAIRAAGGGQFLVSPDVAFEVSDRTIAEMLFGPGTFNLPGPCCGPMYDQSEVAHLRDARTLLHLLLGAGTVSAIAIGVALGRRRDRKPIWRGIRRGGVAVTLGVIVLAVGGLLAFGPLFELFHRVFFPGGNYAFDPRTQHLVQLYPYAFWQIAAAAYGALVLALGLAAWLVARWNGGR